jgi:cell shape-determining protein MreD
MLIGLINDRIMIYLLGSYVARLTLFGFLYGNHINIVRFENEKAIDFDACCNG